MRKSRYVFAYPCVTKHPPTDTVYTTYQMAGGLKEIRKLLDSLTEEGQRGAKIYKLVGVK